jgi:ribosomal protein S18 acetylase RimI-like enzyme
VLDPKLQAPVLEQQYLARRRGYAADFPQAEEQIVLAGGAAVGVIITERSTDTIHLVDIVLRPDAQGAGIGSVILRRLLAEADAEQRAVILSVDPANHRAHQLYVRLGFIQTQASATEIVMQRPPAGQLGA